MIYDHPEAKVFSTVPPLAEGKPEMAVTITVHPDLIDRLLDYAQETRTTLNDVINMAIRRSLYPPLMILKLDGEGSPVIVQAYDLSDVPH